MPSPTTRLLETDAEMRRQCGLEVEIVGIAIHPHLGAACDIAAITLGRGAEAALIGADAGAKGPAAVTLLRFGPDERHRGRQRTDEGGKKRSGRHMHKLRSKRHAAFGAARR